MTRGGWVKRVAAAALMVSGLTGCAPQAENVPVKEDPGTSSAPTGNRADATAGSSVTATRPSSTQAWKPLTLTAPGRAVTTTLHGPVSGVTMKVHVWLPPQYDDPSQANTRFPVVMAYPGGAGVNGAVWLSHGAPQAVVDGVKAGGKPMIIVQPQMQVDEAHDTECTDLQGEPKVGTFLDTDVPNLVERDFRVQTDRSAWGATGVSSGAYCAAVVALRKPDRFAYAAPIDGYFTIDSNLAAGKTAAARATSPLAMASSNPPQVAMHAWYGTGKLNGQLSKHRSEQFAAAVEPPLSYTATEIPGGAHLWSTYTALMPEVFRWFSSVLPAPTQG